MMNLIKPARILLLVLILSFGSAAVPAGTPASQTAAPAPQKGKVAVINTAALQEKIGEYKLKIDALNKQFEPRTKEIQTEADQINALETTIKTQNASLTPARIAEMTEVLEQRKRNYRRKSEDLQAEGERVLTQALQPLKEKLSKFLQGYTAQRGIVILIDLANSIEANTLLWFDSRLDVTEDFIKEYNKANPVAGAPAAPAKP